MKKYQMLKIEILQIFDEDIVRTSGNPEESGDNIIDGGLWG